MGNYTISIENIVGLVDRTLPDGALLRGVQIRKAIDVSDPELKRLSAKGLLDRVRLTAGPTGQVRYTRQSILDLVRTWALQEQNVKMKTVLGKKTIPSNAR